MARINVEDSWFTDHRRFELAEKLGDEQMADGLMVSVWRLAQSFWGNGRKKIPEQAFKSIKNSHLLFDVDLASKHGGFVYVRGTRQYLDWYASVKESAAKGGKSKANRAKQTSSKPLANACLPTPILTPTLTLNKKEEIRVAELPRSTDTAVVADNTDSGFGVIEMNGKKTKISDRVFTSWVDLYGRDFVLEEIKKASAWCLVNPRRAPKSNPARFLGSWLSRSWEWHRKQIHTNKAGTNWDELKKKAGVE